MRGWSYWTIPSLVFVTLLSIFAIMGSHFPPPRYLVAYFLMFNAYAFILSTFSRKGPRYMVTFLPWLALPFVLFFSFLLHENGLLGFYYTFVLCVLVEYRVFKSVNVVLDLIRIIFVAIAGWGVEHWVRDSYVFFLVTRRPSP